MDLAEAFPPSSGAGGSDEHQPLKADYFDFVVSPTAHDTTNDDDVFLHRSACRTTLGFLADSCTQSDSVNPFIKEETNNNTLTALPPVSTITGSLVHMAHHNRLVRVSDANSCHLSSDQISSLDQTQAQDCDYWVTDDSKEQTCNILLEDLNKYCWTSQSSDTSGLLVQRRDTMLSDGINHQRDSSNDDRQNTDGAIYTLTVLKTEPNTMDGLDGCKSPTPGSGSDATWTVRPGGLSDLDALFNMDTSVSGDINDTDQQSTSDVNGGAGAGEQFSTVSSSQFGRADDPTEFTVVVKTEPSGSGDNNNDWKLSDRNRQLGETVVSSESAAESLLRNALQGKLYSNAVVTTTTALTNVMAGRVLEDGQTTQGQDEPMQTCTDEELLLSQLEVDGGYRTTDFEKLKCISNEIVEPFSLEQVCNVGATTVMYTLDPTSGSLGTITLPADLTSMQAMGTLIVTASSLNNCAGELITGDPLCNVPTNVQLTPQQQTQTTQIQLTNCGTTATITTTSKPKAKKYVRRTKNAANNSSAITNNINGTPANGSTVDQQQPGIGGANGASRGGSGNGSAQPRKERSLHYCSICSKGFKDKYSVNVHIRTHTGEKPFACSHCGKSFRQKAHLAKHYQTHNPPKSTVTSSNGGSNSAGSGSSRGAPSPPTLATVAPMTPPAVVTPQQIMVTAVDVIDQKPTVLAMPGCSTPPS